MWEIANPWLKWAAGYYRRCATQKHAVSGFCSKRLDALTMLVGPAQDLLEFGAP
jgi:hypothetical protein